MEKNKIRSHLKKDVKEAKESIRHEKAEIKSSKTGISRDKDLMKNLKKR